MVRRTVGARLRCLFRHEHEPAAVRPQPGPRAKRDDLAEPEFHAAGADRRHDLLLEDRLEDDGEPDQDGRRLELHDGRSAAAAATAAARRDDARVVGVQYAQSNIHGNWSTLTDASASGGSALSNQNLGASKISPALASPANYFEQTFTVFHGTAYHLWVRLRAGSNSLANDSVHVQFSGSVDSLGSPHWRIGSTSSAEIVLQAGTNDTSVSGWGWSDDGWDAPGKPIYFAADGPQTVRVQQREDGAIVDEIVLSPDTYLNTAPGGRDNDATVLPANDGSGSPPPPPPPPPPPSPDVVLWTANVPAQAINGNWLQLSDATAAGGAALENPDGAQPKIAPALASPTNFFEMTFNATAGVPYHLWVRMRAQNNSLSNDSIHLQFDDSVDSGGTPSDAVGYDRFGGSRPAGWSERRRRPWLGMVGQRMGRGRREHLFRHHRHAHHPCAATRRRRDRRSNRPESRDLSDDRARRAPRRYNDYFTVNTDITGR